MTMQGKFKNVIKTNSKFDSIRRNSNIDYDIYRIFNAFPLNLTSNQKSPQNSHRPMGIHHSPHTHPIPISMGIPMGISIPTAAQWGTVLAGNCSYRKTSVSLKIKVYWTVNTKTQVHNRTRKPSWRKGKRATAVANFSYPTLVWRPRSGGIRQNFRMKLSAQKLEGWGYCMLKIAWS